MSSDKSSIITTSLTSLLLILFNLDPSMMSILFPIITILVDKMLETNIEIESTFLKKITKNFTTLTFLVFICYLFFEGYKNKEKIIKFFSKKHKNMRVDTSCIISL